jgi:hypothetical protein
LLRDRGVNVASVGIKVDPNELRVYSLGRFQMAFWFSLVIISFLFIWLITGAYDIITTSILALIGISTGTALSSAVIDNSKMQEILNETEKLQGENLELQNRIPILKQELETNPPNRTELLIEQSQKESRMQQIQMDLSKHMAILTPKASRGFFRDILSDSIGVNFHRLQMFVWTMVLGILFVYSVWARLSMPEFSETLLALQGLTAGTFLGFKIPEK